MSVIVMVAAIVARRLRARPFIAADALNFNRRVFCARLISPSQHSPSFALANSMIGAALFIANQAAALKAKHTLTQCGDNVGVMRCNEDGDAELIDLPEQLDDLPADQRVKVSRWLVSDKEFRVANDRAGDRRALLLAAREGVWVAIGELAKTNDAQRALHRHLNLFCRSAGDLQRKGGVLAHGASLQEAEVLEDHTNASTQVRHLTRWKIVNGVTSYANLSSEGEHIAYKEANERRLSSTRRPNKKGELTAIQRQGDASKGDVSARIPDAHVVQRDNWISAFTCVCHIGKVTHHQARSL
jgi:hypothetical protein